MEIVKEPFKVKFENGTVVYVCDGGGDILSLNRDNTECLFLMEIPNLCRWHNSGNKPIVVIHRDGKEYSKYMFYDGVWYRAEENESL
jgi:hypothetical protein